MDVATLLVNSWRGTSLHLTSAGRVKFKSIKLWWIGVPMIHHFRIRVVLSIISLDGVLIVRNILGLICRERYCQDLRRVLVSIHVCVLA